MNRRIQTVASIALASTLAAGAAWAQHRGRTAVPPPPDQSRTITIPCVEACNMLQHMRVWLFTPPPGSTAYGLGGLGEGRRVWALLPGCRQPNPDDPRDPCPVGNVSLEVGSGSGQVASTEPQNVTSDPNSRRVQSFVVPNSVESVRIRVHRHDGGVRYEAAVEAAQMRNFPEPQGSPSGSGYNFELSAYPSN